MMALGSRALMRLVRTAWFPFAAVLGLLLFAPLIAQGQGVDTVVVRWTAPGDDGSLGTAANYDLRFSLSQINDSNFNSATPVNGLPAPRVAGSREQVTVRGLVRGTTYWFALKTRDDEGNLSPISNLVRWEWQLDTAPPGAPTQHVARDLCRDATALPAESQTGHPAFHERRREPVRSVRLQAAAHCAAWEEI